jgi:uracil-DNA glycosylase
VTDFNCQKCGYHETKGRHYVLGSGNPKAELMIINSMPSQHDASFGVPLNRSDDNTELTRLLASIGLTRDKVWITNLLYCCPPEGFDKRPEKPKDGCIKACHENLEKEVEMVNPKVIVLLGAPAALRVLNIKVDRKSVV